MLIGNAETEGKRVKGTNRRQLQQRRIDGDARRLLRTSRQQQPQGLHVRVVEKAEVNDTQNPAASAYPTAADARRECCCCFPHLLLLLNLC